MKILHGNFGKIIISLFINIGLIYVLLYTLSYSNFISTDYVTFPLMLMSPFLHIFLFLYLIKKIFKKKILYNIILYLKTNSIYFFYSYLSYHFIYEPVYLFTPFFRNDPTDDQFLVEAFRSIYFMSKVTFALFVISTLTLVGALILKKYRN